MNSKMIGLAVAFALASAPASATPPENGYLVIVGSYSLNQPDEAAVNLERVRMAASRCGYTLKHANSSRIEAPRPMTRGRIIHYVGPFTERVADMVRSRIRRCVPDAYVKEVYSPFQN